jgi:hypothetical protein
MVMPKAATLKLVTNLLGIFEAPWIMKRNDTYYLLYAGNNASPTSHVNQHLTMPVKHVPLLRVH